MATMMTMGGVAAPDKNDSMISLFLGGAIYWYYCEYMTQVQ
jgi:hypothetical protein